MTSQVSGTTVQSNNLVDVNPLFVNAATFDFHLLAGSPAINAGTTLSDVPTAFDGTTRPQGAAYDIGAFEYGIINVTSPPSFPISVP